MNRTRLLFYLILGAMLTIVAISLFFRFIGDHTLLQIFIAATIFSAGVMLLDFVGLLGEQTDAGGDGGHDLSGQELGDHDVGLNDVDLDHGDVADAGHHGHLGHSSPVLSVLAYLRMLVYFSFGFGPIGWVALATGRGALTSLLLAIPMGVLSTLLAQAVFRFQRQNTDSSLPRTALLMETGRVLVPLDHTTMGKVRIQVGMSVTDEYALASHPEAAIAKGESVRVVEVKDDRIYVERI